MSDNSCKVMLAGIRPGDLLSVKVGVYLKNVYRFLKYSGTSINRVPKREPWRPKIFAVEPKGLMISILGALNI